MAQSNPTDSNQQRKIKVKYDEYSARYANQTVITGSTDEVFLDFSSGPVPDSGTGESLLPIHTRIAMSPAGARRLLAALQQTLKRIESNAAEANGVQRASLPPVKG